MSTARKIHCDCQKAEPEIIGGNTRRCKLRDILENNQFVAFESAEGEGQGQTEELIDEDQRQRGQLPSDLALDALGPACPSPAKHSASS